jgi:hypothetical protein
MVQGVELRCEVRSRRSAHRLRALLPSGRRNKGVPHEERVIKRSRCDADRRVGIFGIGHVADGGSVHLRGFWKGYIGNPDGIEMQKSEMQPEGSQESAAGMQGSALHRAGLLPIKRIGPPGPCRRLPLDACAVPVVWSSFSVLVHRGLRGEMFFYDFML